MPENFFKKHQYTFAGLGAIAAVAAGVFTFVGNSSTRNEISDNSGTIVGVGEQVTLESGAVVVNEYDANFQGLTNAVASLRIAGVQCKSVLAKKNNITSAKVFDELSKPAFHVAGMLYDPNMSSALSEETVGYIDQTVNRTIVPISTLISSLARDEKNAKRQLERQLEMEKKRKQADAKYQENPELLEKELQESRSRMEASLAERDMTQFSIELHQDQNPDTVYYDVLLDDSLPMEVRLDGATKQLMTEFEAFCETSEMIHDQLQRKTK